jgi:hypothetical protein
VDASVGQAASNSDSTFEDVEVFLSREAADGLDADMIDEAMADDDSFFSSLEEVLAEVTLD